ncbi:MAG: cardiolipin synthase [Burkholderiales bacterium]|nr:cardiolipin synthase [Burkholderiales bacterium]MDQ3196305.1 cardiolipin synthase [Pseudomonadota bacterium]
MQKQTLIVEANSGEAELMGDRLTGTFNKRPDVPPRVSASMFIGVLLCQFAACAALPTQKQVAREVATSSSKIEISGDKREPQRELLKQAGGDETTHLKRFVLADQAIDNGVLFAGNEVKLLINGPATYGAMFDAIRKAKRTIHLETYTLADDEVGRRFAEALLERRAAGVTVKVIYDAVGSLTSSDAYFNRLRSHGVQVREFRPVDGVDVLAFWRANQRDHRKMLVVDAKTAFIGGINISSVYSSGSGSLGERKEDGDSEWRDTQVRIDGPAAARIQELFLATWVKTGGAGAESDVRARALPKPVGHDLVRVISTTGGGDDYGIYKAYLAAIAVARERIWITQAYFLPNDEFLGALKDAAKRGVDVCILLPGFTDSRIVLQASHSNYEDLLKAGIKLYERDDRLLHAKTAVIDGLWSTVGSSNLDYRSFVHNGEANAVIFGQEFGGQMDALFRSDLKHAHQVELAQWQKRSLWKRFQERFSVLFYHLI